MGNKQQSSMLKLTMLLTHSAMHHRHFLANFAVVWAQLQQPKLLTSSKQGTQLEYCFSQYNYQTKRMNLENSVFCWTTVVFLSLYCMFCCLPFPSFCCHFPPFLFLSLLFIIFLWSVLPNLFQRGSVSWFTLLSSGNDIESPTPHSDLRILSPISTWLKNTEFIKLWNGKIFSNMEFSSWGLASQLM